MARKQPTQPDKPQSRKVYCADCKLFKRDTEGMSRSVAGEYFMGVCLKGLTPDTPKKQFANKPRLCDQYKNQ